MAVTVVPLPQGGIPDAGDTYPPLRPPASGDGAGASASEEVVAADAVAEALLLATRTAVAFLYWGGRTGLSLAGGLTRLPLVGPGLVELHTRWVADSSALTRRLDAFARSAVSSLVDAVLEGLDLTSIVIERVDVDRVADRIDVERILARVDVDGVIARADLDAILARIDLVSIAQEIVEELDLPEMVRESSGTLAAETLEGLRLQGMQADQLVSRVVDRVLFRKGGRGARPLGPPDSRDALAGT